MSSEPAPLAPNPLKKGNAGDRGDRTFFGLSAGASVFVLILIVAIAAFLANESISGLRANTTGFFTTKVWNPDGKPSMFGVEATVFGTIVSSILALVLAAPIAIGVALYVSDYAPRRIARPLGYLIDLLAAVPSVVFGLWGLKFLVPYSAGFQQWLADHLAFIPLFNLGSSGVVGRSVFLASLVLAIMILPIIAAVSREIFLQVPQANKEAALALGATKLEMIRYAVLPYSRSGVIGAMMLGLGRAIGETIAIALVLSASPVTSFHILDANTGGNTIAANIAAQYQAAEPIGRSALIASGLVLFVLTFAVNAAARLVVSRGGKRAAAI